MAKEVIMLAKNYDPKKIKFPVLCSEKIDGAAAWFTPHKFEPDGIKAHSRQDKPYHSVQHICDWLKDKLPTDAMLVGELHVPGLPFKDSSGIIRRLGTEPSVVLGVYDWYDWTAPNLTYRERMLEMRKHIPVYGNGDGYPVRLIHPTLCNNQEELDTFIQKFMQDNPHAEGVMIRPLDGKDSVYKFGRSWGLMRWKPWEDIDARVIGFEEAKGEHTGMVGRILLEGTLASGPGKLSHAERKHIWENQGLYTGRMAEFQYKKDASYDKLREPTFQRWRPDKDAA